MNAARYALFCKLLETLDVGCQLMEEYDALPHQYGEDTLYQAESHTIQLVGKNPGITVTDLATVMKKTPSACSQIIRKLRIKGWIKKNRNSRNNREYNLHLTEHGWIIFENHERFDQECYERNCANLVGFTDEELKIYIAIQEQINTSFCQDVKQSKASFSEIPQK